MILDETEESDWREPLRPHFIASGINNNVKPQDGSVAAVTIAIWIS